MMPAEIVFQMRRVRQLVVVSIVLLAVLFSLAAASFLSTRTGPERPTATYLAYGGDIIAFEGTRLLPFDVMGNVTVTIRGEWTATLPTAVAADWNYIGTPLGWPTYLPKSLGGVIEFTATFLTIVPSGGSNYPNGVGPVSCYLVLYSSVPDSVTAVTDIVVTYAYI